MPNIDISVAVATESGLITPIVQNVPSLSLGQISDSVRELAGKAKAGKLQLNEFQVCFKMVIRLNTILRLHYRPRVNGLFFTNLRASF